MPSTRVSASIAARAAARREGVGEDSAPGVEVQGVGARHRGFGDLVLVQLGRLPDRDGLDDVGLAAVQGGGACGAARHDPGVDARGLGLPPQ
ncbi:hypothetical protein [Streptomyces sp. NPDC051219]|uniref:hypothetical protein n=1 Tax=Streptomyces sp. NPDC051219 TaxID=3155283 RepID=UPI0034260385